MAETRTGREVLKFYDRFERVVATLILGGMVVVVGLAVISFFVTLVAQTFTTSPAMDYAEFQVFFDRVLAAVISVELARSILELVAGKHGLPQVRTVVIIGMLALIRKIITLEVAQATGGLLLGISAAVIALSVALVAVFWIERYLRPTEGDLAGPPDDL